jgi:hypothetical protein
MAPRMFVVQVRFSMSLAACRIAQAQGGRIEMAFMIVQNTRRSSLNARGDS